MLEALGPFIKIGQRSCRCGRTCSGRVSVELEHLRADVAPMAYETVLRVLEDEYGVPPHTVFETLDEPLGSASSRRCATLRDGRSCKGAAPGHPGDDSAGYHVAAKGSRPPASRVAGHRGFRAVLSEMWATAGGDGFPNGAGHMRMFAELNRDVAYMACPQVEQSLTTSKVLVMEHVEGIPIDQTDALTGLGYDMGDIGRKLAAGYVRQILDDGFFHADPHPGNLRIREGRIVWLDLGMMGKLSAHDRYMIREAALAVVRRDAEALERFLLAVGQPSGESNQQAGRRYRRLLVRYGDKPLGSSISAGYGRVCRAGARERHTDAAGLYDAGARHHDAGGSAAADSLIPVSWKYWPAISRGRRGLGKEVQHIGRALLHSGRKSVELPGQLSDLNPQNAQGADAP